MTTLLFKLAFTGIRSRLLASALTIAIGGAAAATIVLALEVRSSGRDPWQQTFDAANGAHVLALVPSQAEARAIANLPGVTERGAPVPLVTATLGPRSADRAELAGLSGRTAVNMPLLTAGSQLREGGVVLERSLADARGIEVGAMLELTTGRGSFDLPVLGTAVVPSQPRYPRRNPGLAWVTRATLERIEPDRTLWRWTEALRLANPSGTAAFIERAAAGLSPTTLRSGPLSFESWHAQRSNALADAQPIELIVTTYTLLLLIVAFVVIGILVGARASAQYREIGLLKAAGFTPRQLGAVFALESAALGLIAAALGFTLGMLLAPRLAAPSAQTLIASPTISANPWHILVASCVVIPVLLAGTLTSIRRSTRYTAVEAIRAGSLSPPSSRLARAVTGSFLPAFLPLTMGLGLKDLLARRRRAFFLAAAIAVTGAVVVVALSVEATLAARPAGEVSDVPDELPLLIYTLDAALLLITATTLVAVTLLSVRERIRDYGVLKAIGLTPTQLTSTLVSAHAALAVVASLLAIPLGIGLFLTLVKAASGTTEDAVLAPWWSLALVPIGTVLLVVAATGLPARSATRIRTADALRYE